MHKIAYTTFSRKYYSQVVGLIEQLQDHIVTLDTFNRVRRKDKFGQYITNKILQNINQNN